MAPPVILVSNDDGIHSDGIRALEASLAPLGRVFVVAPETEQSAASHAMSLSRPLRLRRYAANRFGVDGTPVDSVYVGLHHKKILPARPAVVVSGINHGLNLGSDVFYSGTVAAAREGAMRGIPAVAVSLARNGDLALAGRLAHALTRRVLASARALRGQQVLLNLNIPGGRLRGVRATSLGERVYDQLVEIRTDPRGQEYFWIGGPTVAHETSEGTDTAAHDSGFASVTPLSLDLFAQNQRPLVGILLDGLDGWRTPSRHGPRGATTARAATRTRRRAP
jgi:5'-nucleotidase